MKILTLSVSLSFFLQCTLMNAANLKEASCKRKGKPNVVFILVDDLGWRDLQCYGSDFYETPYIDAFAATAMRFTDAYSASPLCSPTRASILTGLEPGRLHLTTASCHSKKEILDPFETTTADFRFKATVPGSCTRLKNSYTTLAESFKALGYSTAFMGKWHLGRAPYIPENQGFDVVVGGREHPGPPGGFFAPWTCQTLPPAQAGSHICDVLTDTAIHYISEHKKTPFMLCLWYYDVHAPFQAKQKLIDKYSAKLHGKHIQRNALMGGMIENLDMNVGRLFSHLSHLGLKDNTIIVFTSDNGGNMYNCPQGHLATNNYPLREGKGNNYEGGVRVPLIVRAPGVTKPHSVSPVVVSTVDHYASLMELVGASMPDSIITDGYSYVPALNGNVYYREPVYSAFFHRTPKAGNLPNVSMRYQHWKLYRFCFDGEEESHRYELYDLGKDIGETNNVVSQNPDVLEKMIAMLDAHMKEADYLQARLNKKYKGNALGPWWAAEEVKLSVVDKVLHLKVGDGETYIETDMIPDIDGQPIVFTFEMKSTASGAAKIIWTEDKKMEYSAYLEQDFEAIHDGQWHHYRVPVSTKKMALLRIVPATKAGEVAIKNLSMETADGYKLREWSLGHL